MMKQYKKELIVSTLLALLPIAAGLLLWNRLPGQLATHWGMSGPAILNLSSHAARFIQEKAYRFPIFVNWTNDPHSETVTGILQDMAQRHPQKKISGLRPYDLSARLWHYLIGKSGISPDRKWNELGHKGLCKLADTLCNDRYDVDGRSTFREEFVTCGGVSLESVQRQTLESKTCPGGARYRRRDRRI